LKTIQVWHDFTCPWCAIGLHNLHVALTQLGHTNGAVSFEPYLLSADTPAEGRDLRAHLGAKYGSVQVEGMINRAVEAGKGYGVPLHFDIIRISPQTIPAHALVAAAPAELRWGLVERLHSAYFQRGENIGDRTVLASIATASGLDAALAEVAFDPAQGAAVRQRAATTSMLGIQGVPHFKIGGRALHGAQDPQAFVAALTA
jgi:predicted DsbA family dithiol-disulfide isomerase